MTVEKEFSSEEIEEMKHKAVLITTSEGTFMIELFPEDAPNTVNNFLKLVESGYYDGVVFHRIIPNFMIQTGDPNTIGPDSDRSVRGDKEDRGIALMKNLTQYSMIVALFPWLGSNHPDSAGSQFFIMHKDNNQLDGKYTAFGRLVPGLRTALLRLIRLHSLPTNNS